MTIFVFFAKIRHKAYRRNHLLIMNLIVIFRGFITMTLFTEITRIYDQTRNSKLT